MCGRFAVTTDPATLAAGLDAVDETGPGFAGPNYNVAPTATIAAVVARHDDPGDRRAAAERPGGEGEPEPTRRLRLMRWGLLPGWVKADAEGRPLISAKTGGRQLINARADKVTTSPAFRAAARHKRCLVPMDGYYEWMANPDVGGRKTRKTPFYIHRGDGRPLLVAGLWSAWRSHPGAEPVLTCTVITTDAPGELGRVHDRMPLLIARRDVNRWLDPDRPAPNDLLVEPPDVSGLELRQVSTLVNNVANNGPELLEKVDPSNETIALF